MLHPCAIMHTGHIYHAHVKTISTTIICTIQEFAPDKWKEVVFYCVLADFGHNKECAVFPKLNTMQCGCQEYMYGCTLTSPVCHCCRSTALSTVVDGHH